MAEMKVEIGAEIKELQSKLNKATQELNKFNSKTSKNLDGFSKSSTNASKSMGKLGGGLASGNSAMTAFSRTVQDAPFGIMGVSNNITNLTEQFGYLKNKTGSSNGALKAMLKDLKGFGGISLAVSVVTSLLLVFGDKIFEAKDSVKLLRKEQDALTKSLEDYVFGLKAVEQANLKGEKRAVKEITSLKLLKSQLNNTNLSLNERKGAIDALRKKYPKYLKDMSDEKLLNGGLTTVYNDLTTSIIKRAKATAATNAIVKNSEELLVLESKLLAEKTKLISAEDKYNKAVKTTTASSVSGVNTTTQRTKKAVEQQKKLINGLLGSIQNLELTNIDLEGNITTITAPLEVVPDDNSKVKLSPLFEDIYQQYNTGVDGFQDLILNKQVDFNGIYADYVPKAIPFLKPSLTQFEIDALALKEKMAKLNEDSKLMIEGSLTSTFSGIGQALGDGLSNGVNAIEAVGKALLNGIGNLISSMGDKLIQLGTAAVLAGTVVKLFGTISGIGAGLAAIAGGVLLKGIGTGISNAGGGDKSNKSVSNSNASSGGGSSSFSGGSRSSFSGGGSSGGTYVFEIQGTKLVGVLSNTLRQNKALGGNLSIGG